MSTEGYSGTPLGKKLGLKTGFKIKLFNEPEDYFRLFSDLPEDITTITDQKSKLDFIHYFTKNAAELNSDINRLKNAIKPSGIIWISWPKQSAKIDTDVNGNLVREIGLKSGLVDIKVCAVNNIWSALKFVIPLQDRK